MSNVYEECPVLEDEFFLLRLVDQSDVEDLLKVYGDKNAVPYFNSDNCGGDNFYYPTKERMQEAIQYWLREYKQQGFVRFAIIDKNKQQTIGTIELFHRNADDDFTNCGLLRLDLRNDYERKDVICEIISVILESSFELFDCTMIATKLPIYAVERVAALEKLGFKKSSEVLFGHDGRNYYDYWEKSYKGVTLNPHVS